MRRMRLRMVMMVMQLMVMAMVAGPTERRAAGHRGHAARSQRLVQLAAGGRVARAQRVAAAARVGRVVPAVADDAAADRIAGVVRLRRLLGGVRVVGVAVAGHRPLGDARRRVQADAGRDAATKR